MLLFPPIQLLAGQKKSAPFWTFDYYQTFFDVDTYQVNSPFQRTVGWTVSYPDIGVFSILHLQSDKSVCFHRSWTESKVQFSQYQERTLWGCISAAILTFTVGTRCEKFSSAPNVMSLYYLLLANLKKQEGGGVVIKLVLFVCLFLRSLLDMCHTRLYHCS